MKDLSVTTPLNDVFEGFRDFVGESTAQDLSCYESFWAWSIKDVSTFWEHLVDYFNLQELQNRRAIGVTDFPGRWFENASINYAKQILEQGSMDDVLIVSIDENSQRSDWTREAVKKYVKVAQEYLQAQELQKGDRVAAYVSNSPEAIAMFLACASLGIVWTAVGSEYQPSGAAQRLGSVEPALLVVSGEYTYKGKHFDKSQEGAHLAKELGLSDNVVFIDNLTQSAEDHRIVFHDQAFQAVSGASVEYIETDFNDPLWIVYSSGTTGRPKAIVHGHGGVVLEALKMQGLHWGLRPGKRLMWHASPSWVMWSVLVSSLVCGSSIVCYNGHPGYPDVEKLLVLANEAQVTSLGVSPSYLKLLQDLHPDYHSSNATLEVVYCTGSPLPKEIHTWTMEALGVPVCPLSGGTELFGAIVGPAPGKAVIPGQMQGRQLGVAAEIWSQDGMPLPPGESGELVLTKPLPSMPLCFWGDEDGSQFTNAYLEDFSEAWRHGDWAVLDETGDMSITGRSDATLNRHGVRFGSAEIYKCLETLREVESSLVVGIELPEGGYWMPLFVSLIEGQLLDEFIEHQILNAIKYGSSPRHLPDVIIEVSSIPRTLTGKIAEIPVKNAIMGRDVSKENVTGSLENPLAFTEIVEKGRRILAESNLVCFP